MKEQEKFDDIIRSKFKEMEFSFSETQWEKAEHSIDAKRKNKKTLWYALVFAGGLAAGILIMLPFVNSEKPQENKTLAEISEKQTSTWDKRVAEEIEKEKTAASETKTSFEPTAAESKETETPIQPKNLVSETKQTAIKQSAVVPANEIPAPVTSKNNIQKETKNPEVKKDVPPQTNPEPIVIAAAILAKTKTENKVDAKKEENTDTEIQPVIFVGMQSKADIAAAKGETSPEIKKLESKIDSLDKAIAQLVKQDSAKPKADSTLASVKQPGTEVTPAQYPKKSFAKSTLFSLDAGTNYIFGWKAVGDSIEARGFNPVFGFGLTHFISAKWAVYGGLQYGSVGYLKYSTKTYRSDMIDFGISHIDTIIDARWIHYATVPVFAQYHFNTENSISFGGTVSYLVNTNSKLIVNSYGDYQTGSFTEKKTLGYTRGFNNMNATVAVAYRRRISNKFSVSAEAHYGLLDIKDNTFFSKQQFERSTGIKLVLSYDIFNY